MRINVCSLKLKVCESNDLSNNHSADGLNSFTKFNDCFRDIPRLANFMSIQYFMQNSSVIDTFEPKVRISELLERIDCDPKFHDGNFDLQAFISNNTLRNMPFPINVYLKCIKCNYANGLPLNLLVNKLTSSELDDVFGSEQNISNLFKPTIDDQLKLNYQEDFNNDWLNNVQPSSFSRYMTSIHSENLNDQQQQQVIEFHYNCPRCSLLRQEEIQLNYNYQFYFKLYNIKKEKDLQSLVTMAYKKNLDIKKEFSNTIDSCLLDDQKVIMDLVDAIPAYEFICYEQKRLSVFKKLEEKLFGKNLEFKVYCKRLSNKNLLFKIGSFNKI
jgi:hypothetical protein